MATLGTRSLWFGSEPGGRVSSYPNCTVFVRPEFVIGWIHNSGIFLLKCYTKNTNEYMNFFRIWRTRLNHFKWLDISINTMCISWYITLILTFRPLQLIKSSTTTRVPKVKSRWFLDNLKKLSKTWALTGAKRGQNEIEPLELLSTLLLSLQKTPLSCHENVLDFNLWLMCIFGEKRPFHFHIFQTWPLAHKLWPY